MFKAKITNRINFPEVDLVPSLQKIAKKIVIPLLKDGILTNNDIYGKNFPKLSKGTIKRKKHSRALQSEGKLFNSFKSKKEGDIVIVYIDSKDNRDEIAEYLQIDGVGKNKKKFKFFGVTDGMEADALDFIKKEIKRWVNRANRG